MSTCAGENTFSGSISSAMIWVNFGSSDRYPFELAPSWKHEHSSVTASRWTCVRLRPFLEGVVVGLVAAVIFFVVRFSGVDVVGASFTARARRSKKARSATHRAILRDQGERVRAYRLTEAAFGDHAAENSVAAVGPCQAVLMTSSARRRLERDDLELTVELDRYLIETILEYRSRLLPVR